MKRSPPLHENGTDRHDKNGRYGVVRVLESLENGVIVEYADVAGMMSLFDSKLDLNSVVHNKT